MTAMRHEPVADRLGVPLHKLPPDWRSRGGGGGMGGGGGRPPRSGCRFIVLLGLLLGGSPLAAVVGWATSHLIGA